MSKTYEIEIQKDTDTDELFFELPPKLLERLNWKTGDDLKWEETNEGLRLRKVKYETVELELDEQEYVKYLKYAHENNMSFNELAEVAVKEAMKKNENEAV
tara:strand:+ start:433 stop:735 length:303 start_codon:yes stop_codon:yes gene_type:complete